MLPARSCSRAPVFSPACSAREQRQPVGESRSQSRAGTPVCQGTLIHLQRNPGLPWTSCPALGQSCQGKGRGLGPWPGSHHTPDQTQDGPQPQGTESPGVHSDSSRSLWNARAETMMWLKLFTMTVIHPILITSLRAKQESKFPLYFSAF